MGWDSVVGIVTCCGLDGPGIGSRWGRDFPHPSRPALGHTQPPYNGYRVSFPGAKQPGCGVDHPPPSSAEVKERVELYLYSPFGPSWPVLGRTLPLLLYMGCTTNQRSIQFGYLHLLVQVYHSPLLYFLESS